MSKMIACQNCGQVYDSRHKECYKCHAKKTTKINDIIFWVIIVTFILCNIICGICYIYERTNKFNDTNALIHETNADVIGSEGRLSLEDFEKIETGMTYEKVCSIAHGDGILECSYEIGDCKTEKYSWLGKGVVGANVSVDFENNKVIGKSQIGLKNQY